MKRTVSLIQSAILLTNLGMALRDEDIGFEDADQTYSEVVEALSQGRAIQVPQAVLESALWACNLLDEKGKFFHPSGRPFNAFVKTLIGLNESFNKDLNYIEATNAKG